jgi:hypothetical protein
MEETDLDPDWYNLDWLYQQNRKIPALSSTTTANFSTGSSRGQII